MSDSNEKRSSAAPESEMHSSPGPKHKDYAMQICIEELKHRTAEISEKVKVLSTYYMFELVFFGVTVKFLYDEFLQFNKFDAPHYIVMLSPIPFFILGIVYNYHSNVIAFNAAYINKNLNKVILKHTGCVSVGWENYINKRLGEIAWQGEAHIPHLACPFSLLAISLYYAGKQSLDGFTVSLFFLINIMAFSIYIISIQSVRTSRESVRATTSLLPPPDGSS